MRRALLTALLIGVCLPASAAASPVVKLGASFDPYKLGQRTTLDFSFIVSGSQGEFPPPLTQIQLRYPAYLGIDLSGLGLENCGAPTLEQSGPAGCPANSVMGYGAAFTGIVLGTTPVTEAAPITILRAPSEKGHLGLLFFSEGTTPVNTRIIFPGTLLPAPNPFGGQVSIGIPLVPTLPGAPYISVLELHATVGPRRVVYYEKVAGRLLAYRPQGILLPKTCPAAGFPFSAKFNFVDGSSTTASAVVRCSEASASGDPRGRKHGHKPNPKKSKRRPKRKHH